MHEQLKLLSSAVVESLYFSVSENIERYKTTGFDDLRINSGWEIETSLVRIDPSLGHKLIPSKDPEHEVKNSMLVYESLTGMTPALARDERVWARLCHVECLNYAKSRWLGDKDKEGDIKRHFFASGVRGCRDQNAVGRLWWNAHIASLASPENIQSALEILLARANYRLQIIDRADTAFRQPLLSGILNLIEKHDWLVENDSAVADFMYEVNKHSGSLVFEALSDQDIDRHLLDCLAKGKIRYAGK